MTEHIMRLMNNKYSPGRDEAGKKEIQKGWNTLCVIRIDTEHLTGKEAMGLVKQLAK